MDEIKKIDAEIAKLARADESATARKAAITMQVADENLDGSAIEALKREERKINEACADRAATLAILKDRRQGALKRREGAELDKLHAETVQLAKKEGVVSKATHATILRGVQGLSELAALKAQRQANNTRLTAAGRASVESGERLARMVPGKTIPAVWAEREVWRESDGSPVTFMVCDPETGEMRPRSIGAKLVRERYCARQEQVIAPRYAESLADEVFIPGWLPTDEPAWPGKKGRRS